MRMRERERNRPQTSWWAILTLISAAGIFGWYTIFVQRGVDIMYDESAAMAAKTLAAEQKKIELEDDTKITVPSFSVFAPNQSWMYVSKTAPLASTYQPSTLTKLAVPVGASDGPMQLRAHVADQLKKLFDAANTEDLSLMVSSAYRSIADQQKLYDEFVTSKGETAAKQFVLAPGASEHHTGYAVDITDASAGCQADSDKCNLSPDSAAWLAEHAPDYGFIIRYPSGKEPITGIAHEPWHLRYVGVNLARKLTANDLTFDEFVEQVTPGRIK